MAHESQISSLSEMNLDLHTLAAVSLGGICSSEVHIRILIHSIIVPATP